MYLCIMKKLLRSLGYLFSMLLLAILPDVWIWYEGVSTWVLPFRILWWIPSLLLVLAELGLQLGIYHRLSVRVLFSLLLFSVTPKIVYGVLALFTPWWIALIPSIGTMLSLLYGFIDGWKRLEVKYVTYTSDDLPSYFDGYKILHFSDFHLGSFPADTDFVRKIVERANDEAVDVMMFTGDLVNDAADEVKPFVEDLKNLQAPDGIFSVWGNHDYCEYGKERSKSNMYLNRQHLSALQEHLGWHQLMNDHIAISHGLATIYIIGVENAGNPPFPDRSNLKKAMEGIPKDCSFKILLTHDPHHWRREVLDKNIQLTLAGHTHAGQLKCGKVTPARLAFKEWGGVYYYKSLMMNVSYGLGGSFLFRLGAWPEMTVITLKRKV